MKAESDPRSFVLPAKRPVAVRRLFNAVGSNAKGDSQRTHLVQRQRGMQGCSEHPTLMRVRVSGINRDEMVQFCRSFRSEQVADK